MYKEKYDEKTVDEFVSNLKKIGVTLSERQIEQFLCYYEMLVETNKKFNLTAITEFEDVLNKHFIDSLCAAGQKDFIKAKSLIDVGTGAGFPGIPIKIAFPEKEVFLLDSLGKRVKFLNEVIDELGLENISAAHGRAEDFATKPEYREKYDLCVSRAVARLSTLSEYCLPFIKVGGEFIAYKSEKAKEEIEEGLNAIKILGGKLDEIIEMELPAKMGYRSFACIKKIKNTPKKYPRKAGTPTKEPL